MPFGNLWKNITTHGGEEFETRTGLRFKYEARVDCICIVLSAIELQVSSEAGPSVSRSDLEKAYELFPFQNPAQIAQLVPGAAFVHAILTDPRIDDFLRKTGT